MRDTLIYAAGFLSALLSKFVGEFIGKQIVLLQKKKRESEKAI